MSIGDQIVGQWLDENEWDAIVCETLMTPPPIRRQNAQGFQQVSPSCPGAPRRPKRNAELSYQPPTKIRCINLDYK
jgi:hypothetical protein